MQLQPSLNIFSLKEQTYVTIMPNLGGKKSSKPLSDTAVFDYVSEGLRDFYLIKSLKTEAAMLFSSKIPSSSA